MRSRRAVVMLWFVLIFLTTASFIGALAVDYGQVLFARSQVQSVVRDAALQASKQYQTTGGPDGNGALLIDEAAAYSTVNDVIDLAVKQGALQKATVTEVKVSFENNGPDNYAWAAIANENPSLPPAVPRVFVKVSYKVTDLSLMDLFASVSGGVKTVINTSLTDSAVICLPGLNPDTIHGVCARSKS